MDTCAIKDILSGQNTHGLWKGWSSKEPSTLVDTQAHALLWHTVKADVKCSRLRLARKTSYQKTLSGYQKIVFMKQGRCSSTGEFLTFEKPILLPVGTQRLLGVGKPWKIFCCWKTSWNNTWLYSAAALSANLISCKKPVFRWINQTFAVLVLNFCSEESGVFPLLCCVCC